MFLPDDENVADWLEDYRPTGAHSPLSEGSQAASTMSGARSSVDPVASGPREGVKPHENVDRGLDMSRRLLKTRRFASVGDLVTVLEELIDGLE
jgi:hypothetical protein